MWSLRVVGALYLASGLWCSINPELAAGFLGFTLSPVGLSEFFSVYGGLQVGLGLAMLVTSFNKDYIEASLFFALITSIGLLIFRLISLMSMVVNEGVYAMALLETIIVMALGVHYFKLRQFNKSK